MIADIPGIIENAHAGAGLGHDFLRHIERTRLLVHVVDVSCADGRDPIDDFNSINNELKAFNEELASRPQIVVANKIDSADPEVTDMFCEYVENQGYEVFRISAAGNIGNRELTAKETEEVTKLPPTVIHDKPDEGTKVYKFEEKKKFDIVRNGNVYEVTGDWIKTVLESTNFDSTDSMAYFQRSLINSGIIDELKARGIKEGDTVKIFDLEFDYFE